MHELNCCFGIKNSDSNWSETNLILNLFLIFEAEQTTANISALRKFDAKPFFSATMAPVTIYRPAAYFDWQGMLGMLTFHSIVAAELGWVGGIKVDKLFQD